MLTTNECKKSALESGHIREEDQLLAQGGLDLGDLVWASMQGALVSEWRRTSLQTTCTKTWGREGLYGGGGPVVGLGRSGPWRSGLSVHAGCFGEWMKGLHPEWPVQKLRAEEGRSSSWPEEVQTWGIWFEHPCKVVWWQNEGVIGPKEPAQKLEAEGWS